MLQVFTYHVAMRGLINYLEKLALPLLSKTPNHYCKLYYNKSNLFKSKKAIFFKVIAYK